MWLGDMKYPLSQTVLYFSPANECTIAAPMASIEEEMSISQITAASWARTPSLLYCRQRLSRCRSSATSLKLCVVRPPVRISYISQRHVFVIVVHLFIPVLLVGSSQCEEMSVLCLFIVCTLSWSLTLLISGWTLYMDDMYDVAAKHERSIVPKQLNKCFDTSRMVIYLLLRDNLRLNKESYQVTTLRNP